MNNASVGATRHVAVADNIEFGKETNMARLDTSDTNLRKPIENHPVASLRKSLWVMLMVLAGVSIAAAGVLLCIWFAGGSGKPSGVILAPALVLEPGDTRALFHIASDESQVRFIIDEELLGNPKTVIGVTDHVAGDILVDFKNPSNSLLGTIRINLRTLVTDNEIRNRALRGQILEADQSKYEFAEFVPTELIGLPNEVKIGTPIQFQIVGQLTVHGVTRAVTFDAAVTPVNATRIEGAASTVVLYRNFGIRIPQAPGVANISDEVRLEIDFVAQAAAD